MNYRELIRYTIYEKVKEKHIVVEIVVRRKKRWTNVYLIAFCLFVILTVVSDIWYNEYYERKYILNLKELPKSYDIVIVLVLA